MVPTKKDLARSKSKIIFTKNGCWFWTGALSNGYGQFFYGKPYRAHRLIYSWFVEPVVKGIDVHHKCNNKNCVNPAHLDALTRSAHSLGDNLYVRPVRGDRLCRICRRKDMERRIAQNN